MPKIDEIELLKDKDIIEEINRFKWIESEKAGHDIGFERASREWINKHSQTYFSNRPNKTFLLWLKSDPLVKFLNKEISFE